MPGVAHSTSEKQKPGPLDLALLFWEVVDVKKASGAGSSTREILFSSIAEYNKCCTSKVGTPSAYHHLLFQSNVNGSVEITSINQSFYLILDQCTSDGHIQTLGMSEPGLASE